MTISLLFINSGYAAIVVKEFSAEAVVTIPGQPMTMSKLFVSNKAVRTEIQTQNGNIVDIVFPYMGKLIKLNTNLKQYIEIPIDKQSEKNKINPCSRLKNASCTFIGNENVYGQDTQKWQIVAIQQGKKVRTLHWVDTKRQLAIREFFNDGSMAEMKLEKNEIVNKRNVEKWVRTISRPDGSTVSSNQWYDPQLEISIKEELPGGYIRELKDIKLGKQNARLFEVPEDYTLVKSNDTQLRSVPASGRVN